MNNEHFIVTFAPSTDPLNREPVQRLRALLRYANRRLGLRCINAVPVSDDESDDLVEDVIEIENSECSQTGAAQ